MNCMFLLALILLLAQVAPVAGADSPRFRGPNGTGVQDGDRLPAGVGATRNGGWQTALPAGSSPPVASGAPVLVTAFEGEKLLSIALDRKTGKERWRRETPRD